MSLKPEDRKAAQTASARLENLFGHYEALRDDGACNVYTSVGRITDNLTYDDQRSIREIALDSLRIAIELRIDDLAMLGVNVEGYYGRAPKVRVTELAEIAETYGGFVIDRDAQEAQAIDAEMAAADVDAAMMFATPVGG